MVKPSVIGGRRLGFGVDGVDDLPASIDDARARIVAQLRKGTGFDAPALMTTGAALELFVARATVIKGGGDKEAVAKFPTAGQVMAVDLDTRLARIATTDRPFVERLALHWLNHFTAAIADAPLAYFLSAYEREAIRPHMLGLFPDLLIAATTHPAMLVYLNNRNSIGPGSRRGLRAGKGLNENHAREVLELHTLGVNGGYSQADIIELAKAMTGWTININPHADVPMDRRLDFDPSIHEPGPRSFMGRTYPDTGRQQALDMLRHVALQPATARYVTGRMVAHFIGDHAPPALAARLSQIFLDTGGDLMAVTTALVQDGAVWAGPMTKVRPPIEFVGAAARLLGGMPANPRPYTSIKAMGQPYMAAAAPNGWPEADEAWIAPDGWKSRLDWAAQASARLRTAVPPSVLVERAFGDSVSAETRNAVLGGATFAQSLTLLLLSPEFQRR